MENQAKRYQWEQDQIAHMKNYIARFGHGSAKLARQAQSKEKTLAKMVAGGESSFIQWTPLNTATSGQAKMARITGWIYLIRSFYLAKNPNFFTKVATLTGGYIIREYIKRGLLYLF